MSKHCGVPLSFEPRDFYNDNFHLFFISYLILVLREKLYASPIYYGRFYGKIIQEKRLSKKQEASQSPLQETLERRLSRIVWSTVSKAAPRSRSTSKVTRCWFISKMSFFTRCRAVFVLYWSDPVFGQTQLARQVLKQMIDCLWVADWKTVLRRQSSLISV